MKLYTCEMVQSSNMEQIEWYRINMIGIFPYNINYFIHVYSLILFKSYTWSNWLNMMHSQLLEGLKCESQIENNGRVRSRGTLPGS
jgi:hypothetical protein